MQIYYVCSLDETVRLSHESILNIPKLTYWLFIGLLVCGIHSTDHYTSAVGFATKVVVLYVGNLK